MGVRGAAQPLGSIRATRAAVAAWHPMDAGDLRLLREHAGLGHDAVLGPDLGTPGRTRVHPLGEDHYVKAYLGASGRKAAREQAALTALVGRALPVPALVDHGQLADGSPWVLLTRLPGTPMDARRADRPAPPAERAAWYRWAGRTAGELHQVQVPAFGPWTADPVADPVHHHRRRSAGLLDQARVVGRLPPTLLDRIHRAQRALEPALAASGPPVLVHRDLNPHNLLGTQDPTGSWTRTGIIDFESSGGGDPLEDLRWLALAEPRPLVQEAFLDGYRTSAPSALFDADRIRYHQLDLVLDIATWPHLDDPSLGPRAEAAAERMLSA